MKTSIKIIGAISAIPTNQVDFLGNQRVKSCVILHFERLPFLGKQTNSYCECSVVGNVEDNAEILHQLMTGEMSPVEFLELGNGVKLVKYKPANNSYARRGIPVDKVPNKYVWEVDNDVIAGIMHSGDELVIIRNGNGKSLCSKF